MPTPPLEGLPLPTSGGTVLRTRVVRDARQAHQTVPPRPVSSAEHSRPRQARELLPAGVGLCVEASWTDSYTLACDLTIRKWKQTENVVTMENLLLTLAQGSSEASVISSFNDVTDSCS